MASNQEQTNFGTPKTETEIAQCKSCEEHRNFMFQYSPTVTFMRQEIEKAGGYVSPRDISCQICPQPKLGGFHPEHGIQLCANYIPDKWTLNDTLSHELIHWYDNTRFKVNWMDLKHHACSEVRAASLSGECALMTEFGKMMMKVSATDNGSEVGAKKGGFRFAKGHQECVKRRAALSVVGHPKCKDMDHAKEVVNDVFRSCFNDTRPYEMIYR